MAVILGVTGSIIVTIVIVTDRYPDSILWLVVSSILTIVAGVVACFSFQEKSSRLDGDA